VVFGSMPFLLSDTVGFIRKLPHHLVEGFKSTLDEVRESDILVHVVDVAHPQYEDHIKTVNNTLKDLGCVDKPTLMVFNKLDLYRERYFDDLLDQETKDEILEETQKRLTNTYDTDTIFMSALAKENLMAFRSKLEAMVKAHYEVRYPYQTKTW